MYRVNDVFVSTPTNRYLIEDSKASKLIIITENEDDHLQYVMVADMVNVQNIQQ